MEDFGDGIWLHPSELSGFRRKMCGQVEIIEGKITGVFFLPARLAIIRWTCHGFPSKYPRVP